jgi:hypothetical protein
MEPGEVRPRGLGGAECPDLAALYRRRASFVTCYFDIQKPAEDMARRIDAPWEDMRRQLEVHQVAEATIDAIARSLSSAPDLRQRAKSACVVASQGDLLLLEGGPTPLTHDLARVGELPALGQLLAWRQQAITYITVLCDLAGADIVLHGHEEDISFLAGERDHHDPLLHKAHTGGWSYPRYERRVENTWERNAKDVLDVLDDLVARDHVRLVMFGGDPRACGLLRQGASARLRPLLRELPLSRSADGAPEHDSHAVRAAVETVVAADTAMFLDHFHEMKAKSLGVEGAERVLAALTAAQVETLVLHENPDDERMAYMCVDPVAAALDREGLAPVRAEPFAARLVDVALAATFLTGASARMMPGSVAEEGVAALLRFPAGSQGPEGVEA